MDIRPEADALFSSYVQVGVEKGGAGAQLRYHLTLAYRGGPRFSMMPVQKRKGGTVENTQPVFLRMGARKEMWQEAVPQKKMVVREPPSGKVSLRR